MISLVGRLLVPALLAASLGALSAPIISTPAAAAQPWYCLCKGVAKRFLASSRHCEVQMHLPKGQLCTRAQTRAVYAPACKAMGCTLKPFDRS